MKTIDVFPSNYLKAEELDGDTVLTIESVQVENFKDKAGDEQQKPVVYFKETQKGMVCNKTNWTAISKQHGDESDEWVGKQITLMVMDVEAFGDIVTAIRVKAPRKALKGGGLKGVKQQAEPEGEGGGKMRADTAGAADAVMAFWEHARAVGCTRDEGLALLKKAKSDFAAALKLLPKLTE